MNAVLLILGLVGMVICGFYFMVGASDPEGRGGSIALFTFVGALVSTALAGYALYSIASA